MFDTSGRSRSGKPHLQDTIDTEEKKSIGEFWEAASNGSCLFLLAVRKDEEKRDVYKQIASKAGKGIKK